MVLGTKTEVAACLGFYCKISVRNLIVTSPIAVSRAPKTKEAEASSRKFESDVKSHLLHGV